MSPQKRVRHHVNPLSILHEHSFDGFENQNPIIMDIGACKGEFVEALAKKFPEKNYIACEIRKPLARKLEEKFSTMPHIVVFDGDAGRNLFNLVGPSLEKGVKLERIYINFPDPWFKDKHKKRRFIRPEFLKSIHSWIPAETQFVFQTDQKQLYQETKEILKPNGFVVTEEFDESPYGVQTDWECAKLREGNNIQRMIFNKSQKNVCKTPFKTKLKSFAKTLKSIFNKTIVHK